ncbi:MAG: IPT/TIG domain-containing protein [Ferruginibacter sp.]
MKKVLLFIYSLLFIFHVGKGQEVLAPVPVNKTVTKRIFMHLMPWFETPASNSGAWGYHWKMIKKDPNIILPNGQRDIAAWFYPLTGPYASSDPDIVEYQALLMKLSGVDGVTIDWYGTQNRYDYPQNKVNSEKLISILQKVGLNYSIVYEDATLNNAADKAQAAKNDMSYMQANYFSQSNYEKYGSKPLLLVFGPQGLIGQTAWTDAFSVLNPAPALFPLWYDYDAGNAATGSFAWIYSDYLTGLNNYYNNGSFPVKIGSAYPGFKTYYTAGGASGPTWEIAHNGVATFSATLDLALSKNLNYIQLNTWNDYGEGTMLEPTVEFGYSFLTTLQQKLGVSGLTQGDLELVKMLYDQRKQYAGNATEQSRLDQVFYYIVSLQMDLAKSLLLKTEPPKPLPAPWKYGDIGVIAAGGSSAFSNDTFTVSGSGADIYGTSDGFQYAYQQVSGDVTITAKVNAVENTNVWAKAGLMIRESLTGNAANAALVITPSNGINFQYRNATGGATSNAGGNSITTPYWLRLVRSGNTITAYYSADGLTWTLSTAPVYIPMGSAAYVGMAVTSHSDGTVAKGIFSNVSVTAPPVISSFDPAYGLTGSTINIKGRFFTGATVVGFGGAPASSFTIVSDSVITAVVGNGQSGNITVINGDGNALLTGFTYQLCPSSSTTLTSGITGTSYQWQVNTGNEFTNIQDNALYEGTANAVLKLSSLPTEMNGFKYRCVVNGNTGAELSLRFVNRWTGALNTEWENAGNWSCGLVPDEYTDVLVETGTIVIKSNPVVRSLTVRNGAKVTVNSGFLVKVKN